MSKRDFLHRYYVSRACEFNGYDGNRYYGSITAVYHRPGYRGFVVSYYVPSIGREANTIVDYSNKEHLNRVVF